MRPSHPALLRTSARGAVNGSWASPLKEAPGPAPGEAVEQVDHDPYDRGDQLPALPLVGGRLLTAMPVLLAGPAHFRQHPRSLTSGTRERVMDGQAVIVTPLARPDRLGRPSCTVEPADPARNKGVTSGSLPTPVRCLRWEHAASLLSVKFGPMPYLPRPAHASAGNKKRKDLALQVWWWARPSDSLREPWYYAQGQRAPARPARPAVPSGAAGLVFFHDIRCGAPSAIRHRERPARNAPAGEASA